MDLAVPRKDPSKAIDGTLQIVLPQWTAAQGMSGDQFAQVQKIPQGISDEVRPKGARVAAELFVEPGENGLPAYVIPIDFEPAVGIEEGGIQTHGALRVILSHDEVAHRMVQGVIGIVGLQGVIASTAGSL